MPSSEVLSIERDGHLATLWLDSAERRNAMGPDFWADLPVMMQEVADDDEVRAVVVAARGPHFSVGLDLKAMGGSIAGSSGSQVARARQTRAEVHRLQASITAVADCPKPVIAACDIRLASADAVFSVRETKIAIVADLGSLQRLPRIIPMGHVAELAYTGKDITADRARHIGLVNDVLPDHEGVVKAATGMAAEIAANSPLAVQGTKAVLAAGEDRSVAEGLDYVAAWNAAFLPSDDLREAMLAFVEKRPPTFSGQ